MQLQIHFASLFNVCKFAAHERIPIRISWHTNYIYPSYPDAFPFGIITMPCLSDCQFGAMHRVCIPWNLFAPKNSSKNICKCDFDTRYSGKNTFPQFGITFAFDSDMTFAAYYRWGERERNRKHNFDRIFMELHSTCSHAWV